MRSPRPCGRGGRDGRRGTVARRRPSPIPRRSHDNTSDRPRRSLYVTYNRASEGDRRADYYADKRRCFPPEIEREAGVDYPSGAYNLGNPIR